MLVDTMNYSSLRFPLSLPEVTCDDKAAFRDVGNVLGRDLTDAFALYY